MDISLCFLQQWKTMRGCGHVLPLKAFICFFLAMDKIAIKDKRMDSLKKS